MMAALVTTLMMTSANAAARGTILTGSPGSGKSSLAIALEMQGEPVVHETAADVIRYHQAKNETEPWKRVDFQEQIAALQASREQLIVPNLRDRHFYLDRSALDCIAYRLVARERPSESLLNLIGQSGLETYQPIVYLVRGPADITKNEYRQESREECELIEAAIEDVYESIGFTVRELPYANLDDRITELRSSSESLISDRDGEFGIRLRNTLRDDQWLSQLCAKWLSRS